MTQGGFPEVDRTFAVRSYRIPRLRMDVELDRDSYRPGSSSLSINVRSRRKYILRMPSSWNTWLISRFHLSSTLRWLKLPNSGWLGEM